MKIMENAALFEFVVATLQLRWSPQQISRALRRGLPQDPSMWLATESIYQALYRHQTGLLRRAKTAAAVSPLRTCTRPPARAHARRPRRPEVRPADALDPRPPLRPTDRSAAGHWEGDLIVGPHHRSAIATLVQRQTRYVKLVHLPAQDSATLRSRLVTALGPLPLGLRQTLTWDQGTEMARHLEITADARHDVYFCEPPAPGSAARREHQRPAAPVLPQVHRPRGPHTTRPRTGRERTNGRPRRSSTTAHHRSSSSARPASASVQTLR